MRRPIVVLLLATLLPSGRESAFAHGAPPAAKARALNAIRFENGLWFDGTAFRAETVFAVDGVLSRSKEPAVTPDAVVDLRGRFVVPPFGDAHNHALGSPDRLAAQIDRFLRDGVFYVKNPHALVTASAAVNAELNHPTSVDVATARAGLTGSGGHPIQLFEMLARSGQLGSLKPEALAGEAYFVADTLAEVAPRLDALLATHPDFVKIYLERSELHGQRQGDPGFFGQRGLDPALVAPIVARAHAAGKTVSAHVTSAADVAVALAAGVDEITHLPLEALRPEDVARAAQARTRFVTTVTSHRPLPAGLDAAALHAANLRLLKAQGVALAVGTDNDGTSRGEVAALVRLGVFSNLELLKLWSEATPRAIFPSRRVGCLQDGCEASFLALDGDPLHDFAATARIALRVKQGHLIEVVPEAPKKPAVAERLAHLAVARGAEAALAEYERLKQSEPEAWDFSEAQLNALGYTLLKFERPADAVLAFSRNAALFPASANAQDSLAEALLVAGRRQDAAAACRRVLELLASAPYPEALKGQLRRTAEERLAAIASGPLKHP